MNDNFNRRLHLSYRSLILASYKIYIMVKARLCFLEPWTNKTTLTLVKGIRITTLSTLLLSLSLGAKTVNFAQQIPLQEITLGTYPFHVKEIREQVSHTRACRDEDNFNYTDNIVINESFIACKALGLAGLELTINWVTQPVQQRMLRVIERGEIAFGGYTFWTKDFTNNLYRTKDTLKRGEFVKGLYTIETHPTIFDVKNPEDFANFYVTSNHSWTNDVQHIHCIGSPMVNAISYYQMFQLIDSKRVDYMLITFSTNDDLTLVMGDAVLHPVPGFKVSFDDSLSYFVSKRYPFSEQIFRALSYGLALLEESGEVARAYKAAGFNQPYYQDWVEIGCLKNAKTH